MFQSETGKWDQVHSTASPKQAYELLGQTLSASLSVNCGHYGMKVEGWAASGDPKITSNHTLLSEPQHVSLSFHKMTFKIGKGGNF